MKKIKKGAFVFSEVLALVLIPLLASNIAYANTDSEGKLNVIRENGERTVVIYYKLFDLNYSGEGENKSISYTVADDSNWGSKEFFESGAGSKYLIDEAREGLNQVTMPDGQKKYINITDDNVEEFNHDEVGYLFPARYGS